MNKNEIELAITSVLVIQNKQSIHLAVDKIYNLLNKVKEIEDEPITTNNVTVLCYYPGNRMWLQTSYYKAIGFLNPPESYGKPTHWQHLPPNP